MMADRYGRVEWGAGQDRVRTSPENWRQPLKWDRAAAAAGKRSTVFCLSLGDIWDNEVDPMWRRQAFDVMDRTPNLIYLLLSKRIGNAEKMCDPLRAERLLPRNAAIGATMVNQDEWDRDLPKLKRAGESLGALFTFASVEPMLGPINTRGNLPDGVFVGGESGPRARPMHPNWARSLRDQCAAAGVAFFFKQWGQWVTELQSPEDIVLPGEARLPWADKPCAETGAHRGDQTSVYRVGKKAAGRLLDGVEHNGMPQHGRTT
jgi:protein gp37